MTVVSDIPIIPRIMADANIPKRVDALKLVGLNQQFDGVIESQQLTRLSAAVVRCQPTVSVKLVFCRDAENHRTISGECQAVVTMICQRCLGEVELTLNSQFEVGLVFDDEQAKQLPRRLEPVEVSADEHLLLWDVIEDELLLSLPEFPNHDFGTCDTVKTDMNTETVVEEKRDNPFDVLAQLKQK